MKKLVIKKGGCPTPNEHRQRLTVTMLVWGPQVISPVRMATVCLTLVLGLVAAITSPVTGARKDFKDILLADVEPSPRLQVTAKLLRNPGFENDADRDGLPDHWTTFLPLAKSPKCAWDSGIGRAGSRGVSIKGIWQDGAGMWQQVVPVKAGAVYILSGYVGFEKVPPGSKCNLQLVFRTRENEVLKMVDFPHHHGTRKLAYDFPRELMVRAPKGAVKVEVNLILRGRGKAFFDDVFFGPAPVGDIAGVVTSQGVPLEGARVAIWGKPWGGDYEAVTDQAGAYKISGIPVASPRYILLASKKGFKTQPKGEVGVIAGKTTTLNFDLQWGEDPVDDLRIKFGSVASVRPLPPSEISAEAVIPSEPNGYPEEIRPYLGSDDCITPNDPAVKKLAKRILESLPPERRTNTCDVAYAVFSWVSHNIEHDGVYSAKNPQQHRVTIEGSSERIIPVEDDYRDVTSGIWQTVTGEGWCWGRSFYDWGFKPAETLRERGVICAGQAWLCCALLRALNIPARAAIGANQFWAKPPGGKGRWVFMSTTAGRTGYRNRGDMGKGFGDVRDPLFYSVLSRPILHEDWSVENKCLWREIHPFEERYEDLQQALEDLEKFKSTGKAPRATRARFPPKVGYLIHYSDLTINLYNIGQQRSLEVRFPLISESEVFSFTGHKAYWTNHPECVKRTWIEQITNPPVEGKERWFHIKFDLTPVVGEADSAQKDENAGKSDARPMLYVNTAFHLDYPEAARAPRPTRQSQQVKAIVEIFESRNIKPHFGFVGIVAQQLQEDFPDVVEKIKAMKIPIGYHPGPGHNERVIRTLYGNMRNIHRLPPEEAIGAMWEFETHNLFPQEHSRAGEPIPNENGGWCTIQRVFGATPMKTDAGGKESLYRWLGGDYEIGYGPTGTLLESTFDEGEDPGKVRVLPLIHEAHIWGNAPILYWKQKIGDPQPQMIDLKEYFTILGDVLPRGEVFQTCLMSHGWPFLNPRLRHRYEETLDLLLAHPETFTIIWPDPQEYQWRPENAPLAFYKRKYSADGWSEVLKIKPPIHEILAEQRRLGEQGKVALGHSKYSRRRRKDTQVKETETWKSRKSRTLDVTRKDVVRAADYCLTHWPQHEHNGDTYGQPVAIDAAGRWLSLAEAFQAMVLWVNGFEKGRRPPEKVSLKAIYGPVDAPMTRVDEIPQPDTSRVQTGYLPFFIDASKLPDPEIVNRQGLPFVQEYFRWMPARMKVSSEDMVATIRNVARELGDRVPGAIEVPVGTRVRPGEQPREIKVWANPMEFLYALAQQVKHIENKGKPGPVFVANAKLTADRICFLVLPRGRWRRGDEFYWREYLSKSEVNTAWLRTHPTETEAGGEGSRRLRKQGCFRSETVYLCAIIHNEEDLDGKKPTGRADFDGNPEGLKFATGKYREIGKLFQQYGVKVNLQSDWTFVDGVKKYDPSFFAEWEVMGHENDAHAHETHLSYPEVKQRLKDAGAQPTPVIGGTLEKTVQNSLARFEASYPQFEILWGVASLHHILPEENTCYVWRPAKSGSWFSHDPKGKIIYIGGNVNPMLVDAVREACENTRPNKMNVYSIFLGTFESSERLECRSLAPFEQFLEGIKQLQRAHDVQWKSLTEIAEIFKAREAEGTLDFSDIDVNNIPRGRFGRRPGRVRRGRPPRGAGPGLETNDKGYVAR